MEKYKKNISSSSRRKNPYQPILTQGVLSAYPNIRTKTSTNRQRKLSAELPDHFSYKFNPELDFSL